MKKEPPNEEIPTDSSIETTWKTFTGGNKELYLALIKQRADTAEIKNEREDLIKYFRLQLRRAIYYMIGSNKLLKIEDFIRIITTSIANTYLWISIPRTEFGSS
jgi:DNA sulfur modification protein DndE